MRIPTPDLSPLRKLIPALSLALLCFPLLAAPPLDLAAVKRALHPTGIAACADQIADRHHPTRLIVATSERGPEDESRHSFARRQLEGGYVRWLSAIDYSKGPDGEILEPRRFAVADGVEMAIVPPQNRLAYNSHLLTLAISGRSVADSAGIIREVTDAFSIEGPDILVLHNDLDLDVGKRRLEFANGVNLLEGHRGLDALRREIGGFYRLRLGIGRPTSRDAIPSYLAAQPEQRPDPNTYRLVEYWVNYRTGQLWIDPHRTYREHFTEFLPEAVVRELEARAPHEAIHAESDPDFRRFIFRLIESRGNDRIADILARRPDDSQWGSASLSERERALARRWLMTLRAHLRENSSQTPSLRGSLFGREPAVPPAGTRVRVSH